MKYLKNLNEGDKFEVPGVCIGTLLKISAGSCKVRIPGEESPVTTTISRNTEVRKV